MDYFNCFRPPRASNRHNSAPPMADPQPLRKESVPQPVERQRSVSGGGAINVGSLDLFCSSPIVMGMTPTSGGPSPVPPAVMNQQPIVKIGHYVLGQTLGTGTFGKVKSELLLNYIKLKVWILYNFCDLFS